MRKLTICVMTVAMMLPTAALAGGEKATGGANYITGGGAEAHASFVAQEGPKGPKGHVNVRNHDGLDFTGTVECYRQDGDVARFSGSITSTSGTNSNGQGTDYFLVVVQDNGEGADASPDEITVNRNTTAQACTTSTTPANQPITGGNIQVH